eukprot:TRINITY_DN300_c0_g1_i1.p1 TRINITY_DN300_c0_g1~~TRINITY_DN300_c0_g1_i1.p1  ORF type:complete len:359 (+),score=24.04 TRINITY_DN300_c0_g1_i1:77-1153(+)
MMNAALICALLLSNLICVITGLTLSTNGTATIEVDAPTADLHAANKRYVDSSAGGGSLSGFLIQAVHEHHAIIDITHLPRGVNTVLKLSPAQRGGTVSEYSLNGVATNTFAISYTETNCQYNIMACDMVSDIHRCGSPQLLQSPIIYGGITPESMTGCIVPRTGSPFMWPSEFTVEVLVYYANFASMGRYHFFSTTNAAKTMYHTIFRINSGTNKFETYHNNANEALLDYTFEANKWTHVAFTGDTDGTLKVYIDSVYIGVISSGFNPNNIMVTGVLGTHFNSGGVYPTAYLDDDSVHSYTRVYSRPLLDAEITVLASHTKESDELRMSLAGQTLLDFTPRDRVTSQNSCIITMPQCV